MVLPIAHARIPPFQWKPYGWRLIGYSATSVCACALPSKGIPLGWRLMTSLPVSLGRILRTFRLHIRASKGTPFGTPKGTPFGVTWTSVTSGSHGTCTTVLQNVPVAHAHSITSGSGHGLFRPRDLRHFRSGSVTSLPVAPPQTWLCPCPHTTAVSFIGGGNRSTQRNYRPVASHWQSLSNNVVSSTPRQSGVRTHNNSGDRHWFHM
jgi:hypothetical protein